MARVSGDPGSAVICRVVESVITYQQAGQSSAGICVSQLGPNNICLIISGGGHEIKSFNLICSTDSKNIKGSTSMGPHAELQKEYFCPVSGFSTKNVRTMYFVNFAMI